MPLPQLCYDVAYFILPHYAFKDLAKLADLCLNTPTVAGPFFYVMAAQARKVEPDPEDAKRFRWHHGQLDDGREYLPWSTRCLPRSICRTSPSSRCSAAVPKSSSPRTSPR